MANTDLFLSLPSDQVSRPVSSANTAWTYGQYIELARNLKYDISVIGLSFHMTAIPAVDTTIEFIFDIATGNSGSEVVKFQIPSSFRSDTAVGIYLPGPNIKWLPEPVQITAGSRVSVCVANSVATSATFNGIRLLYQSASGSVDQPPRFYHENYKRFQANNGITTTIGGVL